jgi:uncharacterized membrane protein
MDNLILIPNCTLGSDEYIDYNMQVFKQAIKYQRPKLLIFFVLLCFLFLLKLLAFQEGRDGFPIGVGLVIVSLVVLCFLIPGRIRAYCRNMYARRLR